MSMFSKVVAVEGESGGGGVGRIALPRMLDLEHSSNLQKEL